MPNAGEIIERLARESERQKIEIEALKRIVPQTQEKINPTTSEGSKKPVELQYILDRGGEEKEARLESRNLL